MPEIEIILHRPQSSENIGAAARAMKNFGLTRLVLVDPRRFDAVQAHKMAVHAGEIIDGARRALTLEEAVAPCGLVVPTTERVLEGRPPPLAPREAARRLVSHPGDAPVALLFGAEANGLTLDVLARFVHYSTIPSDPRRRSLNLAQAVLLYAWEIHQARGDDGLPGAEAGPGSDPAPMELVTRLRARARALLLAAGFLNPQAPDPVLDELVRLLQRASPTRREAELLLAALAQLERTSAVVPKR